jgi:hypothetical protein
MHERYRIGHLAPWKPMAAALMLASLAAVMSLPASGQEALGSGPPGSQGVFDPRRSGLEYSHLRPWLRNEWQGYDPRMYGAPPPYPRTTIYGEHARYYGGPNYGHLRPGGPWGQPPSYDMPATPNTGIYGEDSRYYGGPNYNLLR